MGWDGMEQEHGVFPCGISLCWDCFHVGSPCPRAVSSGFPLGFPLPILVPCAPAALQDRLCRQQRDAEREQSRLQEAVANLESRLGEQEQLLEQVGL